jgi:Ca-activated chloride channel family protein
VTDDASAQKDLDPFVAARLERSRTAQTLTDANLLFEQGRLEEAQKKLKAQADSLDKAQALAHAVVAARPVAAPQRLSSAGGGKGGLDDDFDVQRRAVAQAEANFAQPPPAATPAQAAPIAAGGPAGRFASPPSPAADTREGKAARKENQARASELGF